MASLHSKQRNSDAMPTFEYQAQNQDGQTVKGVVFGSSLDQALQDLSGQGLKILNIGIASNPNDPLTVASDDRTKRFAAQPDPPTAAPHVQPSGPETEQRSYVATSVVGPLVGKVPLTRHLFFFRQLSTMLEAGVPFVQSLETLAKQEQDPRMKHIIWELKGHVEVGRPMSVGMQRYPEVFSPIMLSLMRAGEEGGFLDAALKTLADYTEREIALRNLYKRITFLPKVELSASIVVILVANYIIEAVGGTFRLWSPLTMPETWIVLTPIIVVLFLFSRIGLANPRVKYNYDAFLANTPVLGPITRQLAMAKFGRALGALHRGGVPINRSIQLASDACGNEWLRTLMRPASKELETGAGVTETLGATGAFSPIVLNMVETGEHTGKLDLMVNKMAGFYEDESETKSTQMAKVIGVCLTILVCIYFAIILIKFYSQYAQSISSAG